MPTAAVEEAAEAVVAAIDAAVQVKKQEHRNKLVPAIFEAAIGTAVDAHGAEAPTMLAADAADAATGEPAATKFERGAAGRQAVKNAEAKTILAKLALERAATSLHEAQTNGKAATAAEKAAAEGFAQMLNRGAAGSSAGQYSIWATTGVASASALKEISEEAAAAALATVAAAERVAAAAAEAAAAVESVAAASRGAVGKATTKLSDIAGWASQVAAAAEAAQEEAEAAATAAQTSAMAANDSAAAAWAEAENRQERAAQENELARIMRALS